ncbi:MAG: cardiolipin synthase [Bacteroidetes bacterium]|nr:cardiolipin synthase [Bacteroidota bacterium]
MNWILVAEIIYILIIIIVCIRIILDTGSSTKASAYILLVIFLPVIGIFIYFSFGINYRKRKLYSKDLFADELKSQVKTLIEKDRDRIIKSHTDGLDKYSSLVNLALNQIFSPISDNNNVELLINGENKFPAVFNVIKNAKHHIHLEYYIFEPDKIGMQLIELLILKAVQGVKIRFIFDDFGARHLRKVVKRMRAANIEVYPFYKIKLLFIANRLNYRNHRKIIVVDGETGFMGGINVSDKYINAQSNKNKWFWRDTHLKVSGSMVHTLQYIFMIDWNFCSGQKLLPDRNFFSENLLEKYGDMVGQVVGSGPDSDAPLILQTLCRAISLAKEEVLITNPYFIPNHTLMEIILITAFSGVKVKLLVPGISDSTFVNMANHSHFGELLNAGVEIYTYTKGFIHAKTMVIDSELAFVGTANMDYRSFDLNFEVNAMIFDQHIASELRQIFYEDLKDASQVDKELWKNRPMAWQLLDRVVRLVSPLL